MKKYVKVLLISIFVFFMFRAYSTNFFIEVFAMDVFSFATAMKIIFPYSMVNSCMFALIVMYVSKFIDKLSDNNCEKIVCLFFSLLFTGGNAIVTVGAFVETFYSKRMLLFYVAYCIGCYFVFRFVIYHLKLFLNWISTCELQYYLSERIQFVSSFIVIAICWSPYIIFRYPAGFEWDAYAQIADFFEGTMTAHWPPASSAWMGIFVLVGDKFLGSTNAGIFIYCVVQMLVGSLVFSYVALVMRRLYIPAVWTYISIIVFALVPIYPGYFASVIKDCPFSAMVVLFVVFFTQLIFGGWQKKLSLYAGLLISGLLMCVLRNNGVFILIGIIVTLVLAAIVKRKIIKPGIFAICVMQVLMTIIYLVVVLPELGIPKGSEAEALSVPFQQTARLVSFYPEEITDEESKVITKVLDYDNLPNDYDPRVADHVKAAYHADNKAELLDYFSVWIKQGLRRPDVYIDAFLANARGFLYPDVRMGNSVVVSGVYSQVYDYRTIKFDVPYSQITKNEAFKENVSFIENLPIVFPFVNIALQCWIPFLIMIFAIYRKDGEMLLVLVPSIIGVLVCLASPTYDNNGARYALPVVYTNLLMLGLQMKLRHTNK